MNQGLTTPYALTADILLRAAGHPPGNLGQDAFSWWADLADATGPALLPFLTRPECYERAPLEELGLSSAPLRSLIPHRGEMWVLFCFRPGKLAEALCTSPLRSDGFPLILEWRKDGEDSPLLSTALRTLAVQVREQLGGDGWSLHPAFDRYGDLVAFSDAGLFSDSEHVDNVGSAWGALAAGLWCVMTGRNPPEWTFPTVQWDARRGCAAGVAGLAQKLSVAADCGAAVVSVARSQRREAADVLADLRKGAEGARFRKLQTYSLRDGRSPVKAAAEIVQGFAASRRLRRRIVLSLLVPSVIALSLWGAYCWDTHRTFSKYYAAVTCHYGLPEGLHEVTPEEQRRRGSTFRFDYAGVHNGVSIHHPWQLKTFLGKARKLVRVVNVNARNVPEPIVNEGYGQMPAIQEFEYADDGRLMTVLIRRRGGEDFVGGLIEKQMAYDDYGDVRNGHVVFRSGDGKEYAYGEVSLSQIDPALPREARNEIFECVIARDKNGRMTRKEYRNLLEPIADGDGVGGIALEYDDEGLVRRQTNLAVGGTNSVPNQWGVVSTDYLWNGPLLTNVVSRDAAGRIVKDRIGVYQYAYRHDEEGNVTSCLFLDAEGRPCLNQPSREWGNRIAECRFAWTNGLQQSRLFLGVPGKEAEIRLVDGNRPGMVWKRTPWGDICEETFLDAAGERTTNAYGICTSRFSIDDRTGKVLHAASYGLDGRTPASDGKDGIFAYSNVVDAAGNPVLTCYLDADGHLTTNLCGAAVVRTEFDVCGRTAYQIHLDACGHPVRSGHFIALEVTRKRGRVSEWRYCAGDEARTTVTNFEGVARVAFHYDDSGRLTRRVFHSLPGSGNTIRIKMRKEFLACAWYEMLYDGRGNLTSCKYYDAEDRLLQMPACSYAFTLSEYDCRGRMTALSYYDARDRLVACSNGASRIERRYAEDDDLEVERTFIAPQNEEPALWGRPGVSRIVLRYAPDGSRRVVDCRCYAADGKLLSQKSSSSESSSPLPCR